jgi:hypothetical protein
MLLALSFNGGSVLALHFVEYLEESTLKVVVDNEQWILFKAIHAWTRSPWI